MSAKGKQFYEAMRELAIVGIARSNAFLKCNKLSLPRYDLEYHPRHFNATIGTGCGIYTPVGKCYPRLTGIKEPVERALVQICLANCAVPVSNPAGRRWSFPGWKSDRTPVGVVAHEAGHHVIWELAQGGRVSDVIWQTWRTVARGKRITSYEPTLNESLAETLRLFILNPALLKHGLPMRYSFVTEVLGLKPSELRSWEAVLSHHSAYVEAGYKWIDKQVARERATTA